VRQRIVVPFDAHVIGQGFNSDTAEWVGRGLIAATVGEETEGLALALVRQGPDALAEGEIERDPVTALNEAIQQHFDELHAEV
jgi:hypothetical protein